MTAPHLPTQRQPERTETTPAEPKTYIATTPSGGQLLVTVWDDGIEVASRIGSRWGAPFQVDAA